MQIIKKSTNFLSKRFSQDVFIKPNNGGRRFVHINKFALNEAYQLQEKDYYVENEKSSRLEKLRKADIPPFSKFLTDTFGRNHNYLRISVTERCNLRCTYCMPEEGVPLTPSSKLLTETEIIRVAKLFIEEGVDKIRFTGGEPLIRRELPKIIGELSKHNLKSIGITTNGILLQKYLPDLISNGLTHLNISLDSLNPRLFEKISRRPSTAWFRVWKSIEMAEGSSLTELKLNVVVMRGVNDGEINDFVELTKERKIDVRFIEYMPFSGNKWDLSKMVPYEEMLSTIRNKYETIDKLEDSVNHTAKAYQIPGFKGKFGFITSMSDHFCGGCNRLRITADGNMKVCLFGNAEVSLRDVMRSGATNEDILELIGRGVKRKHAKHAGMMNLAKMENRPMILIDPLSFPSSKANILFNPHLTNKVLNYQFMRNHTFQNLQQMRSFSTKMSHIDSEGKAKMVDVSSKKLTIREAVAQGVVQLSELAFKAVSENTLKKGDVLTVAQIAGIIGAKKTSDLIPLCHSLQLSNIDLKLELDREKKCIVITSRVKTISNTGVEMEALTGVSIAALTVYDMCKAIDKGIIIKEIRLLKKTGGKTDFNAKIA